MSCDAVPTGVPETTPVAEFIVSPLGNFGEIEKYLMPVISGAEIAEVAIIAVPIFPETA